MPLAKTWKIGKGISIDPFQLVPEMITAFNSSQLATQYFIQGHTFFFLSPYMQSELLYAYFSKWLDIKLQLWFLTYELFRYETVDSESLVEYETINSNSLVEHGTADSDSRVEYLIFLLTRDNNNEISPLFYLRAEFSQM